MVNEKEIKEKILRAIEDGATIKEAAVGCGISRQLLWLWRKDEEFAKLIEEARVKGAEVVEDILLRCCNKAEIDPRYQKSLDMYLRAFKSDRYHDRIEQKTTIENEPQSIKIELTDSEPVPPKTNDPGPSSN